ncbi:bifunctional oligoribonuclease/PAP phosphatase NrnA [Candidatus Gracilibacteria bacterium]|nr:bifunctional oligoribonuclease/PAP phosphatase NrnA [Candidatus Gracilibacteria bacterium]
MQNQIQKLGELIQNSQKILLINHIRMDGDAWGSLGGLALILREMGKEVHGINDCGVPPALQFLGDTEIINPELDVETFNPDIIISLDASDTERLGETYIKWKSIFEETILVNIDHHISNPQFGNINIVDAQASSVCEIMVQIIQELKLEQFVSSEAATFLYTGLQTDSNMYFNTNTRAATLRAGAVLLELGADFRLPVSELYKKRTQNQIRVWQYALDQIEYHQEGNIASCVLTREGLKSLAVDRDELGLYFKGLVSEILINIEGVKVAFLIYPLSQNENKVSMRSQEGYNVAKICESFGGGGHKQAAGFQSEEKSGEIITDIMKKINFL